MRQKTFTQKLRKKTINLKKSYILLAPKQLLIMGIETIKNKNLSLRVPDVQSQSACLFSITETSY